MRIVSSVCGILMCLGAYIASAQTPPPTQKSDPVVLPAAEPGKYNVTTTRMGVLLKDPDSKAVLVKYIPQMVESQDLDQASNMSLKDMQQALQAYAPELLSDKVLAQIQGDLNKLPAKK